jgi:putative tRNA adenosine deaminase-associated protein
VSYFAVALARTDDGWTGRELDLDEVDDLEALAEELREFTGEGAGPALLLLEEDDEYVGLVRVDGGTGSLDEPRVFLSDRRAVTDGGVAALLWEEVGLQESDDDDDEDDQDEGTRPVAEPVGDAALLADLGTPAEALLDLCAEEGLLPADVLTGVADRAGFLELLEGLREG